MITVLFNGGNLSYVILLCTNNRTAILQNILTSKIKTAKTDAWTVV